ncbi:hypothetical protein L7F22_053166 [Adiantum nelumboides]|nr:hypothetical protein [Adiantum nelumboides]MCO5599067.1 hypothetical protein [Adiantum nelumboides]
MLYLVIMALAGWLVQAIVDPNVDFSTVSSSGETSYLMTIGLISGAAGLGSAVCGFHMLQSSSTGSYNACLGVGLVAAILTFEILGGYKVALAEFSQGTGIQNLDNGMAVGIRTAESEDLKEERWRNGIGEKGQGVLISGGTQFQAIIALSVDVTNEGQIFFG